MGQRNESAVGSKAGVAAQSVPAAGGRGVQQGAFKPLRAVGFCVLGAVEAYIDGRVVDLGHVRQQCVLAALLVDVNEPVSVERLVDRVWGDRPPQRARNALYSYISRLRRIVGDGEGVGIRRQRGGYVLAVDRGSVDLHCFDVLFAQARACRQDERACALFEQALGLWRGDAFAGLDTVWLDAVRENLHQQRLAAELEYAEVRLRLGRHAEMLAELTARARAHPLDERACGQLMRALYRCGRTGDALAQYQVGRRQLAEELGIDPGPELQRLHLEILSADPAAEWRAPVVPPVSTFDAAPPSTVVPRQLPTRPAQFTGRVGELGRLAGGLRSPSGPGAAMALWVIDGTGGVGKTWLALRSAHEHAPSFPDGQLYANLRGFGPSGSAVDPAEAVRGFLTAFGVPGDQVPAELDARIALYRSLLAGKRVLIVLDNARDVAQVRPLLPGSPGCVVVVTSRSRLTGLIVADGARPLSLDLLSVQEARDLLARRLGNERVNAEPQAVTDIIARCARLPLALAIAAARAAAEPRFSLAALAGELRDVAGELDAFEAADQDIDVRTVFSWSYRVLSPDAAVLFRMLGLHPGPDFTAPAAASLVGLPLERVRRPLAELTRVHLLTEHVPGRYTFHDLLRAYAAEQAHTHDDAVRRHDALHRTLDYYLHTAHAAARLLKPERDPIELTEPLPGTAAGSLATIEAAWEWFTAEHRVLLACVERSAAVGLDGHAWRLAWAMKTYLFRRGHWHEQVAIERIAADAAGRAGDLAGLGGARFSLAEACVRLGRLDDAESHYRQAVTAYSASGDPSGEADTYLGLAELAEQQHRFADALRYAQQALDMFRRADDPSGVGLALNSVGWFHTQLGEHHEAVESCRQALALLQELGSREGEAGTWHSLGCAHRALDDDRQAAICFQHALDLFSELGNRYDQADTLANLGDIHHAADDPGAAHKAWQQALDILEQLNHPDADRVRAKLDELHTAQATSRGPL